MKKFSWRLQKILDLREKQQRMAQAELLDITQKLSEAKGQLFFQKQLLKHFFKEIKQQQPEKRISSQQFFMSHSAGIDKKIETLRQKTEDLNCRQQEKLKELRTLKKEKQTLEKLRAKARQEFIEKQKKLEQNENDEIATRSFCENRT